MNPIATHQCRLNEPVCSWLPEIWYLNQRNDLVTKLGHEKKTMAWSRIISIWSKIKTAVRRTTSKATDTAPKPHELEAVRSPKHQQPQMHCLLSWALKMFFKTVVRAQNTGNMIEKQIVATYLHHWRSTPTGTDASAMLANVIAALLLEAKCNLTGKSWLASSARIALLRVWLHGRNHRFVKTIDLIPQYEVLFKWR